MQVSLLSQRKRVLIVEDEGIISLTMADLLSDAGFSVVGPVASTGEALSAMEYGRPQAAVVDLSLQDGFCTALPQELQARSIPFLIFSGYPRGSIGLPELDRVPWFEKPGHADEIIAALSEMVDPSGNTCADGAPAGAADAPIPVYDDGLQQAVQASLSSLADIDLAYDKRVDALDGWSVSNGLKERLLKQAQDLHRQAREPHIRRLAILHAEMMSLTVYRARR